MDIDTYYKKSEELDTLFNKRRISEYQYKEAIKHLEKLKGVKKW